MKEKIKTLLFKVNDNISECENINLINAGLLDSLDMFQLISEIEDEFEIEIDGEDIIPENFRNVDTIVAVVEKYVNQ